MKRSVRCNWSSLCQRAPSTPPMMESRAFLMAEGGRMATNRRCIGIINLNSYTNRPVICRFSLKLQAIPPILQRHGHGAGCLMEWFRMANWSDPQPGERGFGERSEEQTYELET